MHIFLMGEIQCGHKLKHYVDTLIDLAATVATASIRYSVD